MLKIDNNLRAFNESRRILADHQRRGEIAHLDSRIFPGGSQVDMGDSSKKDKWSIKMTGVSPKPNSVQVCLTGMSNCDDESAIGGK